MSALQPGTSLGPYDVVSLIGAGGMGEVYRARDRKLGRDVALKVLPDLFVSDPERAARFEREAQALAALNHPNIGTIHGFHESDGIKALVLELVEGPTLADRIAEGPLPLDEALPIARQIAEALEYAHERGVVHRDLKPANVKITADGKVKVLDFGLAKMLEGPAEAGRPAGVTNSPTLSVQATYAGVILGTAAYMSPEQARGRPVDRRADIWAFGCVLFEMLTGHQTFHASDDTVSDAIAVILLREPDWTALPAATPTHIRTLLRRCLQKDLQKRLPHIGVARLEIEEGGSGGPAATVISAGDGLQAVPTRRRALARTALGLLAGVAITAALGWWLLGPAPAKLQPVRFTIVPQQNFPLRPGGGDVSMAISPDGTQIAYISALSNNLDGPLVVRAIDHLEPVPMPGVTGRYPFFSPDGQWVGFFAGPELKKVSITGGPAITLCRTTGAPRGATWGPDNTIVFATNDTTAGLWRVSGGGGEPTVLTKPDLEHGERDHYNPAFLPGRLAVLYMVFGERADGAQVGIFDLASGQRKILIRGGGNAAYVDLPARSGQALSPSNNGLLIYSAVGSLRAVRFDPARLEVLSDPVPVLEQVMPALGGAAEFAVSRTGTLVYAPDTGSGPGGGPARTLVWIDRRGREQPLGLPAHAYAVPRLSPDGMRIAVDMRDQENDIWIWDVARKTLTRLTFDPGQDSNPNWTPDGRQIVFNSSRAGILNLFRRAADGTGTDERLTTSNNVQIPTSMSPDGKSLMLFEVMPSTGADLRVLHLDNATSQASPAAANGPPIGKLPTEPLIQSSANEYDGELSPDGRFLAYYSSEAGQNQVYVRPFPNVDSGRWQISTNGGTRPAWSRSRRELFYLGPNTSMMAVPVQTTPSFSAGNPAKLFDGRWYAGQNSRSYDVSADGQRFLMIKDAGTGDQPAAPLTLNVVVNWAEELKLRVAPAK